MIGIADTRLTENEIEAAVAVLRSGALRQGKVSDAFEAAFAAKVGARHAITCANGSAALHLVYMADFVPGDEVLVPSFTFIATASMAAVCGVKPIICDVDPDTFLIDLADAARRITPRTKAISPVHLFGNPCDVERVREFATRHRLKIIWDAAQAHGATSGGKDIGGLDDYVCYSFYPSKNMFVGEGGMVCTNDDEVAHRIRYLRMHGQTGKYYHTMLGLNYRLTDVEAAIGLEQMKRLDSMLSIRRDNAARLSAGLRNLAGLTLQRVTPGGVHAWHQFCVLVDAAAFGCDRDALAQGLAEAGVASGVHYPRGLHQQPVFEDVYGQVELAVSERLAAEILALPVHHGLGAREIDQVVAAVRAVAGRT